MRRVLPLLFLIFSTCSTPPSDVTKITYLQTGAVELRITADLTDGVIEMAGPLWRLHGPGPLDTTHPTKTARIGHRLKEAIATLGEKVLKDGMSSREFCGKKTAINFSRKGEFEITSASNVHVSSDFVGCWTNDAARLFLAMYCVVEPDGFRCPGYDGRPMLLGATLP